MAADLLADPQELADWLGISANDTRLLAALRAASRKFRAAVRHDVTLIEGDQVTLDGNGRQSLLLPVWPTIAVAEVLLDGEELIEGTDYSWSQDGILRRLGCLVWPDRLRCVEVTYSHGWAVIPEDITGAVIEQARAAFTSMPGLKSKAVGGQSVTFDAGVTADWSACVQRHAIRAGAEL